MAGFAHQSTTQQNTKTQDNHDITAIIRSPPNFACGVTSQPDMFASFEFKKDRSRNVGTVGVEISRLHWLVAIRASRDRCQSRARMTVFSGSMRNCRDPSSSCCSNTSMYRPTQSKTAWPSLMPGFHHSVAVLPLPSRRSR